MPRLPGRRNADYAAERARLIRGLAVRLETPGGASASFRELAAACGVSVPTLRHYFGDRDGAVRAVLADRHAGGEEHLRTAAGGTAPAAQGASGFDLSVRALLAHVAGGFEHGGLERLHALGLAAGLDHAALGPAYLAEVLEPTLQAVEARLAAHQAVGQLRDDVDLRHAALTLVAPVLLLFLHQQALGGTAVRPADVPALLARHGEACVRAFGRSEPPGVPADVAPGPR